MPNYKTSPTQASRHSGPTQVKEWLEKQKYLASNLILIAIDNDCLIVHAAKGEWLASLDWSGKQITVIEPENVVSPYAFRAFNSALSFLDALLLHHFIKTSETRVESVARAPLPALAG